ncbi:MAG: hypothetical protein J6V32_06650 [Elusimicrobiaceae bacterium]|nr:hypothetical protein [Elusimicrobiaceae bacterium]
MKNPSQNNILYLSNDTLIGQGTHKKCFLHPSDKTKCIKIAYNSLGEKDLKREIFYLNTPFRKKHPSYSLPAFYGPICTNYGQGYIWELVKIDKNFPYPNLGVWLRDKKTSNLDIIIHKSILKLKESIWSDEIVTMSIWPENILLEKQNSSYRAVLVNDLGSAACVPLVYYVHFLRKKHIYRRWENFCQYSFQIAATRKKDFVKQWETFNL